MAVSSISFNGKRKGFQRRWVKALIWFGAVILLLLIAALIFLHYFTVASLPDKDGETIAAAVEDDVDVYRDERGAAQIQSDELSDLFYTQGYVTAQDRLFQMDMTRRLAGGELAEVIGEDALESDKFFRTYGMHRAAGEMIDEFDEETAEMVDAYAAGVTAYIDDAFADGEQPLEFRILGYEPEPWTPEDTAIAVKYMGYTLTGNFEEELTNYELVQRLGPEAAEMFPDYGIDDRFPVIDEDPDITADKAEAAASARFYEQINPDGETVFDYEDMQDLTAFSPEPLNGSNNWAISGEHTESGAPLIGDDPHLGLAIPSVWYQTHLELTDDFHSIGVTVPGIPGVVLGHNSDVAWGVTSLSADYEDVFLERVNPENPNEYLYDGEWEEAEIIDEKIAVNDKGDPYNHRVEITRNGPVMNKVTENGPYQAFSMRWSGLEPGEELNGILRLNRSENTDEFLDGLDGFVTPGLSWVFADTDDNIGFRGQALLPERTNSDGRFPVPGWDPDYQWDGFIDSDDLPEVINPDDGYIMTANNRAVSSSYAYEIGRNYFPYRALRLKEMIETKIADDDPLTLEDTAGMQLDFTNTQAQILAPKMIEGVRSWEPTELAFDLDGDSISAFSETEETALSMLENWDGYEDADSPEALIWQLWYESLPENLYERYLHVKVTDSLTIHDTITQAAEDDDGVMFNMLDEEHRISFSKVMRETFHEAVKLAEEMQGSSPEDWRWGEFHQVEIDHPLGEVWPLNHVFNLGSWEVGGSGATPGAMGYDHETGTADHAAGWRMIGDLADPEDFYDIMIPGQSGQWRSPHYDDQLETWMEGGYEPMIYAKNEDEASGHVRFVPE
ncbi:penicillin acylase family protein [Salisediminibacterium halotolerans]|uniref:penicillin acylase family protein n=1 Tax=Salisediminibacterium halotolerans TaxID=517425 RepID=UPI000F13B32A|nr:penicillin acylase family protein [Salisediminibacterium halotolerans]RLJ79343.1 penicillin amidase [Actinophytocola xinjiangensis]RPE83407.1 penicillin amidase [Salisediminibacterium halotolerans]TWG37785.1 penicillin amidase [Salisediminibacterium halotolerans]GEL08506.1 beta-lactam antibiotic acylase [Salisediminibacterium halotolerans]